MNDHSAGSIAVTADVVLFTGSPGELSVVVVRRGNDPYRGTWALPGGFVDEEEDLPDAAVREMEEETGLSLDPETLHQLGVYGRPDRDPRGRVVTVVYWGWHPTVVDPRAGSDAAECRLVPVRELIASPETLAFDHHQILNDAYAALASQTS